MLLELIKKSDDCYKNGLFKIICIYINIIPDHTLFGLELDACHVHEFVAYIFRY